MASNPVPPKAKAKSWVHDKMSDDKENCSSLSATMRAASEAEARTPDNARATTSIGHDTAARNDSLCTPVFARDLFDEFRQFV
jgi:hypothetical protein